MCYAQTIHIEATHHYSSSLKCSISDGFYAAGKVSQQSRKVERNHGVLELSNARNDGRVCISCRKGCGFRVR
ncbi:hypothetical protein TELCIR_26168 [Teladorsagia circumcincta]|uniref:Uncharacterized protein n=1 Tax=Teladorsagia circumcincta TaxID=45464 RepID=A0A2G9T3K4_TELCI|nr:hypothetical protein TELCIR_26168 [Teladorsagia circumcincta]